MHQSANRFVRDMIAVYNHHTCLFELDHYPEGFSWIDQSNYEQSVFSFIRYGKDRNNFVVVVLNMTPNAYDNFLLGVPNAGVYEEIINSDKEIYGGSNIYNGARLNTIDAYNHGYKQSLHLNVSPLSISILKYIQ